MFARHHLFRTSILAFAFLASQVACRQPADEDRGLRIAVRAQPSTLDPHLQDETPAYDLLVNVYEGLVRFDTNMRIEPALASSWSSPDDLTWVFSLRPDVSFHDGTELDADDVVASLRRAREHPESKVAGYLTAIESFRVLDSLRIEIKTLESYPILLNKLAFVWVIPSEAVATTGALSSTAGSGPYEFSSLRAESIHLRRFSDYWGGPADISRVHFDSIPEGKARIDGLLEETIDLATAIPVRLLDRLKDNSNISVRRSETLDMTYLHLDLEKKPFSDVRVRRALHLGLDRSLLARETTPGFAEPSNQFVPPLVFGHSSARTRPADTEKGRQLLAEAGYGDGLDVELELYRSRVPEELMRQLGELGFRITERSREWADIYQRLQNKEVTFYYGLYSLSSGDASDLLDGRIHSSDAGRGYGDSNYSGYSNAEVDALIEQIGGTLDFNKRLVLLAQCFEILDEEVPLVPLFVPYARSAANIDLEWTPRPDGAFVVESMSWRKTER